MIAMDRITLQRYKVLKRYDSAGTYVERETGRRYNLIKKFI